MKKKICATLSALCILLSIPMVGCSSKPPAIADVRDQLVERIEQAVDVNTVLFGAGLPVYDRDGAEENLLHRYYNAVDEDAEYIMTDHARYTSTEEIEAAVRSVYATAYAESILTPLLTGVSIAEVGLVSPATYRVQETYFLQKADLEPTISGTRLFDYGSMKILKRDSTADYIKVSILSRADAVGSEWKETHLSFALQDGEWLLAGPSC